MDTIEVKVGNINNDSDAQAMLNMLEVRFDNLVAQNLYKKMGFDAGNPPYHFWEKLI